MEIFHIRKQELDSAKGDFIQGILSLFSPGNEQSSILQLGSTSWRGCQEKNI